jgi:hypothetical protein
MDIFGILAEANPRVMTQHLGHWPGFLDLTAGQLSIDGTDARSPEEVRALLAWSPEQPTLFPASLRANLRVGAPRAADRQITDLLRQLRLGCGWTGWSKAPIPSSRPGATRSPAGNSSVSA